MWTDGAVKRITAGYVSGVRHKLEEGSYSVGIGAIIAGICSGYPWVSLGWLAVLVDVARHGW